MKQLVIIAFAMMLGACSSMNPLNKNINKGVDVDTVKLRGGSEVPEWFFDYPKDDEWVYGVATGYSEDMQFAIDKGIHDAKIMIADKLQNYINGDFKKYNFCRSEKQTLKPYRQKTFESLKAQSSGM